MDQQQPSQPSDVVKPIGKTKTFVNPYKRPRSNQHQGASSYTSSNSASSIADGSNTTIISTTNDIDPLDESTLNSLTGVSLMKLPMKYAVNLGQNLENISPSVQKDTCPENTSSQNNNRNHIHNHNDPHHDINQSLTNNVKTVEQSVSNNVSLADRLPTNNVSFGYATILTVPETRKAILTHANHLCSKCNHTKEHDSTTETHTSKLIRRHIRVSGTVIYIDPKGHFLIMGDALFHPRPSTKMSPLIQPSTPSLYGHKRNVAPTPVVNAPMKSMISTSLSGKKQRLITVKKNTISSLMKPSSKYGIQSLGSTVATAATTTSTAATTTSTATTTTSTTTSTTSSLFQSNKNIRHGSNTTHMSPVEQIVQKKGDMIMIDISKMEIVIGKPGDNIMVIGDIQSSFDIKDTSKEWDLALQCLRRKWFMDENKTNSTKVESDWNVFNSTCNCMGWIEAKIVKDITGIDMVLYQEALEMRRAYFSKKERL
jgi:hypothetical protein